MHRHPEEHPQQEEMPFAIVRGEPVVTLPKDLYIPPDALEVILEAFEGPLDLRARGGFAMRDSETVLNTLTVKGDHDVVLGDLLVPSPGTGEGVVIETTTGPVSSLPLAAYPSLHTSQAPCQGVTIRWHGLGKRPETQHFTPGAGEVLGLPDKVEPVAFTPLGYPADAPRPKQRKSLDQLVRYNRW